MRLVSLAVAGFRGFPRHQEFDLDADAIVLVGANGHGKTSLFDAVLWALSGRVPRLDADPSRIISMYAESGQARVALTLTSHGSGRFTITRSFDGTDARVSLDTEQGQFHGPSAEGRIIDLVWPDAASATDPREALSAAVTRSVYLQQDLVRQFVEASSNHERFAAVSELVGAGRVTELQASLERAKRAWSTATNQRQDEVGALRQRLAALESRLSDSTTRAVVKSPSVAQEAWNDWWKAATALGVRAVVASPSSREAPSVIDGAIKQLDALRRSAERRLQALTLLRTAYTESTQKHVSEDVAALRANLSSLERGYAEAQKIVDIEQTRLAEVHRLQAELKERSEQLKALASLALRHLDDRCPVCDQTYDREETRRRLEKVAAGSEGRTTDTLKVDRLPELLVALEAKRKEVLAAELAVRSAELTQQRQGLVAEDLDRRAKDLGLIDLRALGTSALPIAFSDAAASTSALADLQRRGEELALGLAQSSGLAALDELRSEARVLEGDIEKREKDIAARNRTGDRAQRVIEALREAGSAVVRDRLRQIAPILQDVYTRIDPHPAFRVVTFLSKIVRGKGHLSTIVSDPIEQKDSDLPATVLSSSQVNALAVSVFLALNIGIPKPPLSAAMLDDPLQSLDDINLLGLVDLLRRTKDERQLFVSTHDVRFGELMARKLRPRTSDGRTVLIELEGWSRQGPVVSSREVRSDPVSLRLVAAAG